MADIMRCKGRPGACRWCGRRGGGASRGPYPSAAPTSAWPHWWRRPLPSPPPRVAAPPSPRAIAPPPRRRPSPPALPPKAWPSPSVSRVAAALRGRLSSSGPRNMQQRAAALPAAEFITRTARLRRGPPRRPSPDPRRPSRGRQGRHGQRVRGAVRSAERGGGRLCRAASGLACAFRWWGSVSLPVCALAARPRPGPSRARSDCVGAA